MTLTELNKLIVDSLLPQLGKREAEATARLLLEDILEVTPTTLVTRGERIVEPETEAKFRKIIQRIQSGEPPQYITGRARFMGMDLKVTKDTLIPRPETAELVDIVTDYVSQSSNSRGLRILDVGTGSGCISIALARALPFPEITAIDVSPETLKVAEENARTLRARIDFVQADVLQSSTLPEQEYDIIVSNPPYIAEKEMATMESRVKDFEPHSALFVPDSDPLRFYRAIADIAKNAVMFFEINPIYAEQLRELLSERGYECQIRLDSYGKKRFALAGKNL